MHLNIENYGRYSRRICLGRRRKRRKKMVRKNDQFHLHPFNYSSTHYNSSMGYNESCTVNNCTWHCCNFNGDCPEWYNNGQWQYTECYYYYGVDPTLLIWTTTFALVGALVIIFVACCCYKDYKKRQEELLKDNAEF